MKLFNKIEQNPQKAIYLAGVATLLANLQLMIISSYIVIYLEDLMVSVITITLIVSLRNFLQLFLRVPLGEISQVVGRKPLLILGHFSYTTSLLLLFLAEDWVLVFFEVFFVALGMAAFCP